jgi:hypothetical protein
MTSSSIANAPLRYDGPGHPRPRWKLLRTLFRSGRPIRRFAPRLKFNPMIDAAPQEIVAHWGEHMIIEDIATALHRDGTVTTLRHIVTQLHGAEHLAAWDETVRSYNTRRERHQFLEARLLTPENSWMHAQRHTHIVSAPGPRDNRNGRTIVVRFSPLRPGVIVEFEELYDSFQVDEFGPAFANNFFFRTAPPCRRRRYTVAVAKPFRFNYQMHHWDGTPEERQLGDYRVSTWDVHNAEGVEFDEWTPPFRDFGPWVDVTTSDTWTPFARQLRGELETWSNVGNDVRTVARELSQNLKSPLEKASAAYAYVAGAVRYGRPPSELQTRNSRAAEQIMRDLRGDCKDKSALLVQLLRSMNFKANVAAVLTGDAGRTPFLPSARFNHALVRLEHDGQVYWLDAASGPFSFGELPPVDQGIQALVLGGDAYHFEQIRPQVRDAPDESRHCTGRLSAEGTFHFQAKTTLAGEAAARLRIQLTNHIESHRLQVLQAWLGHDYPGAVGSDFLYGDVADLSAGFEYRCDAHLDRAMRRIQDLYVFRIPWANQLTMTGPMTAAQRNRPLVVPLSFHAVEVQHIELPDGVVAQAIPDPAIHECDWGGYSRTIEGNGTQLRCERRLRLRGEAFVPAERFPEMQDFWRQCSWSDGAEVVLRAPAAL